MTDQELVREAFETWWHTEPLARGVDINSLWIAFAAGAKVGHRLATQAAIVELSRIREEAHG